MFIHNFDPVLIDLGFFEIRWYSAAYIVGILIGWMYANKIIKLTENNQYNFKQIVTKQFDDLIIYLVIGIIIGGRLGYVIFYNLDYYSQNLLEIFKLWQGGMSFHGGLLGVIISIIIFSKKSQVNFFKFSDIVSCVAPIGILLGRIANFINGELVGRITNEKIGIIFRHIDDFPRHASQIYEAFFEGIVLFFILFFIQKKQSVINKKGYLSSLFLIFYSFFRFICEFFREPDSHIGLQYLNLTIGQIYSIIFFIIGIFILFKKK